MTKDWIYAVKIAADGEISIHELARGEDGFLSSMQEAVGGYIETVPCELPLQESFVMIVNEEGKFEGYRINKLATVLYGNPHDVICGDALIVGVGEVNGERDLLPMPRAVAEVVASICEIKKKGYSFGGGK